MLRTTLRTASLRPLQQSIRLSSTSSGASQSEPTPSQSKAESSELKKDEDSKPATGKKTMAQMDEELQRKMAGLAGDGGEAGVELEGGQPVSMKRSVRENMFRYI